MEPSHSLRRLYEIDQMEPLANLGRIPAGNGAKVVVKLFLGHDRATYHRHRISDHGSALLHTSRRLGSRMV